MHRYIKEWHEPSHIPLNYKNDQLTNRCPVRLMPQTSGNVNIEKCVPDLCISQIALIAG